MTSAYNNLIAVHCPHCLATSQVPRIHAGQRVNCQKCGRSLAVPIQSGNVTGAFDDLLDEPTTNQTVSPGGSNFAAPQPNISQVEPIIPGPDPEQKASPVVNRLEEVPADSIDSSDPFAEHSAIKMDRIGDEGSAFDFGEGVADQGSLPTPSQEIDEPGSWDSRAITPDISVVHGVKEANQASSPPPADDEFKIELDWVPAATGNAAGSETAGADPFADNPDRPLKIEGLEPGFASNDTAGVRCGICDTLIYVPRSQLGQKVKCPECFSQIDAVEAAQRRSSTNPFNRMMGEGVVMTTGDMPNPKDVDQGEYQLSEPVDRPKVVVPESYGLATDQRDLLTPQPPPADQQNSPPAYVNPVPIEQNSEMPTVYKRRADTREPSSTYRADPLESGSSYWKAKSERSRSPEEIERERMEADPIGMRLDDFGGTSGKMSQWLKGMSKDLELWARSGVATVGLGVAYWMVDIIWGWMKSESPPLGYQFWALLLGLIGAVGFLAALLILFISASLLFQRGTERHPGFQEWPGYGVGDWMPALSYVLPSFWLSSLPGMLLGLLLTFGTGNPGFILIVGMASVFVFSPPLLASAVFSQTYYKIVDLKMIKHFTFEDVAWLRFLPATGLALAIFAIGSLVLLIPMFIFSFLGAGLQVLAIMVFASFTGLYCRLMAEKAAEESN